LATLTLFREQDGLWWARTVLVVVGSPGLADEMP
jgi:hypothetical protein